MKERLGQDLTTEGHCTMQIIRFYFDYISSNAYLAWTQLPALAEAHGFAIDPVPVLFAGLLEARGQLGPAEIPAKALWMARNNLRKAAILGVPLNPPAFHPFNPLLALRISSLPLPAPQRLALIDTLFRAVWVEHLHVSDAPVVARLANDLGLAGARLVAEAQSSESKDRLRAQTDDAIARGVFGVPSMGVGDELFWGYDDFPYLERFLAGNDPLNPAEWQKWHGPARPSAVRRRFRTELSG
ncbi:MAG TPA: 2-hydroxychromene-2-carboxylate isomerase [Candidatus Binatia bacterium]|nr:2-hydroxychromene-2-carboxylate isomerase [Candidatus Binatia bacterium]